MKGTNFMFQVDFVDFVNKKKRYDLPVRDNGMELLS